MNLFTIRYYIVYQKYKIQIEKGKEDDKVRDVHTTEINSYLLIKASLKMGLWLTWSN